jgi:hypothetical protein
MLNLTPTYKDLLAFPITFVAVTISLIGLMIMWLATIIGGKWTCLVALRIFTPESKQ